MKNRIISITLVVLSIVFGGCNNTNNKPTAINQSLGFAGELNITTDLETYKYLRDGFKYHLATPQQYLIPNEPFFRINFISMEGLKGSYLEYQTQLFVITESNKDQMASLGFGIGKDKYDSLSNLPGVSIHQFDNVWAKNQSVFYLFGTTPEAIRLYLKEHSDSIQHIIYNSELKNFGSRVGSNKHPLSQILADRFSIEMAFPKFMEVDIQKDSFFSLNWQEGDANCNILIGILGADIAKPINKESMLKLRNAQGKKHLQMDTIGVFYLGTSNLFDHKDTTYSINNHEGFKINGWWVIEGLFRGGPFTRYVLYHEPSKNWISIEGLVYFPNVDVRKDEGKSKSRYLRTLESFIHTLK